MLSNENLTITLDHETRDAIFKALKHNKSFWGRMKGIIGGKYVVSHRKKAKRVYDTFSRIVHEADAAKDMQSTMTRLMSAKGKTPKPVVPTTLRDIALEQSHNKQHILTKMQ